MKALAFQEHGGLDKLRYQDVARPDHGVRDLLVPELVEPAVLGEGERLQEAPSPTFGAFTSTAMLP